MGNINKVILVGRLGADPELKRLPTGSEVCSFSVATSDTWDDKQGQRQERTEWHRVSVWGKQAAACAKYLAKGRQVYVEGSLRARKYTGKDGVERTAIEINATDVKFLGGKGEGGGSGSRDLDPGPIDQSPSADDLPF
jgi:single-strand DNA-binding protein